jgi:hypothetical protein
VLNSYTLIQYNHELNNGVQYGESAKMPLCSARMSIRIMICGNSGRRYNQQVLLWRTTSFLRSNNISGDDVAISSTLQNLTNEVGGWDRPQRVSGTLRTVLRKSFFSPCRPRLTTLLYREGRRRLRYKRGSSGSLVFSIRSKVVFFSGSIVKNIHSCIASPLYVQSCGWCRVPIRAVDTNRKCRGGTC